MTPAQREAAQKWAARHDDGDYSDAPALVAFLRALAAEPDHMDELRKACAELLGNDPATWPSHGNAPLAIAASMAILCKAAEPQSEPVAWWLYGSTEVFLASEFTPDSEHRDEWVPLFASPPRTAPLTDEQREALEIVLTHYGSDYLMRPLRELIGETK